MDTLRMVEVTADGVLVLMAGDGRKFRLAVDEQIRSAIRRSRNGTTTVDTPERPGPREVQARIRAGADAEQVAAQTGLDVDYVRRFEGPVLAERAHVADLARATPVDRGGDPAQSLERVVVEVLTGEGLDVDDISWDSRKVDGTRWQVVARSAGGTEATWAFDTATRSLEPTDAEAERLSGVERRRRLTAVRESVFDVERPAPTTAVRGGTVDLLDALARQRGRRPTTRPAAAEGADGPDGPAEDEDVDVAAAQDDTDEQAGTPGPDDQDGAVPQAQDSSWRDRPGAGDLDHDTSDQLSIEPDLLSELELDAASSRPASPGARSGPRPGPAPSPARPAAPADAAADRRGRRRRSAVPSWDEIVFGARREES